MLSAILYPLFFIMCVLLVLLPEIYICCISLWFSAPFGVYMKCSFRYLCVV
nr:MAG TPA: hypothetical protein [Herelleviridae sp.]